MAGQFSQQQMQSLFQANPQLMQLFQANPQAGIQFLQQVVQQQAPQQPAQAPQQAPASAAAPADPAVAARKAARKRDRATVEKAAAAVPDSPIFCSLLEAQQRVDDLISMRRSALREAMGRLEALRARLRITLTHTWQTQEAPEDPPAWVLHLHGRVLDPDAAAGAGTGTGAGTAGDGAAAGPGGATKLAGQPTAAGASAPAQGGTGATPSQVKHPMTAYLRRVTVRLVPGSDSSDGGARSSAAAGPAASAPGDDADISEDQGAFVWERSFHTGPHKDSIEVRMRGLPPGGLRALVTITPDQQPERFLVPPPLSKCLGGLQADTKPRILAALLHHLRQQRLLDANQTASLPSDLAEAVGVPRPAPGERAQLPLREVEEKVLCVLQAVPPVRITHTIKLPAAASRTAAAQPSAQVVDVECDTLPPFNSSAERQAHVILDLLNPDKEIDPLDAEMAAGLRKLTEKRRRRALLLGYAQSPVEFTAGLLATQAREVRITKAGPAGAPLSATQQRPGESLTPAQQTLIAAAANAKELEPQRWSEIFRGKWAEDAAVSYLGGAQERIQQALQQQMLG